MSDELEAAFLRGVAWAEENPDDLRFRFKAAYDFADAASSILSALEPTTDAREGWERETGWLLEQPAAHGHGPLWFYLGKDDGEDGTGWTSDSIAALRFARKQDAESYIADIGWTEIVATEHEWLGPRAPRR
jgi:hypothetical protein